MMSLNWAEPAKMFLQGLCKRWFLQNFDVYCGNSSAKQKRKLGSGFYRILELISNVKTPLSATDLKHTDCLMTIAKRDINFTCVTTSSVVTNDSLIAHSLIDETAVMAKILGNLDR